MNCTETKNRLEPFLSGKLSGAESRAVRMHIASCSRCASVLSPVDRIETLTAVDEEIEPSAGFQRRFMSRLETHRAGTNPSHYAYSRWSFFAQWSMARQLAAAGSLAVFLFIGLYLGVFRMADDPDPLMTDITIAENLPLLEDMRVIENLDLLEHFEEIQGFTGSGNTVPTVH